MYQENVAPLDDNEEIYKNIENGEYWRRFLDKTNDDGTLTTEVFEGDAKDDSLSDSQAKGSIADMNRGRVESKLFATIAQRYLHSINVDANRSHHLHLFHIAPKPTRSPFIELSKIRTLD